MQKIMPSLWFDDNAEEAIHYYVDTFNGSPSKQVDSKVVMMKRYPEGGEGPMAGMEGKILTGIFELAGQRFMALDGGPVFKFNESISFQIECADQEEVDYFWGKLSAVPDSEQCGWVKDKFGLSWQIIPKAMGEILNDSDPERAGRALNAMLQMKKIDIQKLQDAADGK